MTFQPRTPFYPPGPTAMLVLERAAADGGFVSLDRRNERDSAVRLHVAGFLDRHRKISSAFRISTYGQEYLAFKQEHRDER